MIKIITLFTTAAVIAANVLTIKATYQEPYERAGMTEEEFIFISSVVEAESDRSESLEGRILIAETILNRVNSPLFEGDTITEILTASGQFSTVVNGRSIVERTELSDQAVIIAVQEIESGTAPEVLFFNCIGYNYGTPYGYVDGNYFMTYEEA
jgi:spore germination cell wall hydrolase CwlJ-like protein